MGRGRSDTPTTFNSDTTMMEVQQERRREPRVTFCATVRLKFERGLEFADCRTSNISINGVFVEGAGGVVAGEKCAVDFQLIGSSSSLLLKLTGEVVRVEEAGVALQFVEVDQDSFCHLQNIVYVNYRLEDHPEDRGQDDLFELEDESLYLGLAAGGTGKAAKVGRLDGFDSGEKDEFDDDLDRDILDSVGFHDDDDF